MKKVIIFIFCILGLAGGIFALGAMGVFNKTKPQYLEPSYNRDAYTATVLADRAIDYTTAYLYTNSPSTSSQQSTAQSNGRPTVNLADQLRAYAMIAQKPYGSVFVEANTRSGLDQTLASQITNLQVAASIAQKVKTPNTRISVLLTSLNKYIQVLQNIKSGLDSSNDGVVKKGKLGNILYGKNSQSDIAQGLAYYELAHTYTQTNLKAYSEDYQSWISEINSKGTENSLPQAYQDAITDLNSGYVKP